MRRKDELGRSVARVIRPNGRGGLELVDGVQAVIEHMEAIILTVQGQRRHLPGFGLKRFVFTPIGDTFVVARMIRQALVEFEDRIYHDERLRVTVDRNSLDLGFHPVNVHFVITGETTERTMSTGFRKLG